MNFKEYNMKPCPRCNKLIKELPCPYCDYNGELFEAVKGGTGGGQPEN